MITERRMVGGIGGFLMAKCFRKDEMAEIVRLDLNGPGAAYVNSRLESGGVISRLLLQISGPVTNAFSPLPSDVSSHRALQFESGGTTTESGTLQWLASYAAGVLHPGTDWCFLVEDSWAKVTDPPLRGRGSQAFIAGRSVMYAIAGRDFSYAAIKQLLRDVTSFEYIGMISTTALPEAATNPLPLNDRFVDQFVRQTRCVVVSAFDREGVLISEIGR